MDPHVHVYNCVGAWLVLSGSGPTLCGVLCPPSRVGFVSLSNTEHILLLPMCLMQRLFPQKELNTLPHHHPPPLRTICMVPLASSRSGTTDQILAHNHPHQLCGWQSLAPRSLGTEPAGMAFPWRFYHTQGLFQTACKPPRAPLMF